jgi:hypothetical protein
VLVCGLTSLGAEELKALRRAVRQLGFQCKMEMGWLNFTPLSVRGDWSSLFKLLKMENSITPLYFKEGDRVIDLEYGKFCSEINGVEQLCKLMLLGWSKVLTCRSSLTAIALVNSKKKEENGNN